MTALRRCCLAGKHICPPSLFSAVSRNTSTLPTPSSQHQESPASLLNSIARLSLQPKHYAKVHIHDKAYIVTKGDVIHLPVHLKNTNLGDTLTLNRVSALGSRDYTLRSTPTHPPAQMNVDGTPKTKVSPKVPVSFVDPALFDIRATVIEHTKQPMQFTIKKKRRNRHAKLVKSKQNYTVLRVSALDIVQEQHQ